MEKKTIFNNQSLLGKNSPFKKNIFLHYPSNTNFKQNDQASVMDTENTCLSTLNH